VLGMGRDYLVSRRTCFFVLKTGCWSYHEASPDNQWLVEVPHESAMEDETTLITTYALPTAAWEPWYEEYRYGALYLYPPGPLREQINTLRQRYDPRSQAICDAHISLTVPVPRPLRSADAIEIRRVAQRLSAFEITWGPPYQYPGVPGLVLRIEPAARLLALVSALEACTCFHGAGQRRHPFSPHMTIAEFITLEQSAVLARELASSGLEGHFWCTQVVYAVPDAAFHFTERDAWPLGLPT
jgi:2'-5' RNA ligase